MLRNYFKIAIRNIQNNKFFIFINVMGLALSIACAILIFTTVKYNLSFDNFHTDSERIYRIVTEQHRDNIGYNKSVPNPLGKAIRDDYDFAEKVARIATFGNQLITLNDGNKLIKLKEAGGVAFAEPEFFQIFNYPLLRGDKNTVLSEPNSVVLTERMAKKYFGNEDPINKTFKLQNRLQLKVTGVLKNLPANSDRQTEIYSSFITLKEFSPWHFSDDSWGGIDDAMQCFVRLRPKASIPQIESLMFGYVKKHRPTYKNVHHYKLQPLEDVHFDARYGGVMEKRSLWILSVIGLFLIITACVNFINLATAQALKRSKEIGIRKVMGSMKWQLFWQFICETAVVCIIAAITAYGFSLLMLNGVNSFFATKMSINILSDWQLMIFIFSLVIAVTFLAGSYPGLVLSGFQPVVALKGKLSYKSIGSFNIRRTLIVTQLSISMFLIIGILVIIQQIRYIQKADLGFAKDAVVMIPLGNDSTGTVMSSLKQQFISIPGVEQVSICYAAPASEDSWNNTIKFDNQLEEVNFRTSIKSGDEAYIPLFKLQLTAGRNLLPSDTVKEFVVNEALLRKLNIKSASEALGRKIYANAGNISGPIVGVVKDFHDHSFRDEISPVAITTYKDQYSNLAVKIGLADVKSTLTALENTWSKKYPDQLFEYKFLDDNIASFYENEGRVLTLIQTFSFISIFIGCLGLFGLISFMIIQKTKEIGIRKVLGGSIAHILWIFGKEFSRLVLFAFLIAAPAGWWLMNDWLQDFQFRIEITVWTFVLALIASFVIVAVTIGIQTFKATLTKPVDSLKAE